MNLVLINHIEFIKKNNEIFNILFFYLIYIWIMIIYGILIEYRFILYTFQYKSNLIFNASCSLTIN